MQSSHGRHAFRCAAAFAGFWLSRCKFGAPHKLLLERIPHTGDTLALPAADKRTNSGARYPNGDRSVFPRPYQLNWSRLATEEQRTDGPGPVVPPVHIKIARVAPPS